MLDHEVLRQCDIFAALTSGDINRIIDMTAEKEYEAGAVLFHEKEPAELLYVLKEGKVAIQMISALPPGRTVTVDVASVGDIIGWAPLVEPHVHDVRALCLQKSRVLAIDGTRLRQFFRDNNQTYVNVMKGMVRGALLRLNDTRQLLVSERFWLQKVE
ncbi:MAG: cyclic nucleotide-binding domain-containing protein [Chloroflexi bacterium]|nr:cyclic nucleotide-binding domain-containing protein [Chloroflexota bacterium]